MGQEFTAKGFSMEVHTSSNEKFIPAQYETFSRLEAEFFGAIEEYAISYHDAEESITKNK